MKSVLTWLERWYDINEECWTLCIRASTAKGNQSRGLMAEYGLVAPIKLARLRAAVPAWLEDAENGLTDRFRELLSGLWNDLITLDRRVTELDHEINMIAQSDPVAKRLQQLRGVGPMVATALVVKIGYWVSASVAMPICEAY